MTELNLVIIRCAPCHEGQQRGLNSPLCHKDHRLRTSQYSVASGMDHGRFELVSTERIDKQIFVGLAAAGIGERNVR